MLSFTWALATLAWAIQFALQIIRREAAAKNGNRP